MPNESVPPNAVHATCELVHPEPPSSDPAPEPTARTQRDGVTAQAEWQVRFEALRNAVARLECLLDQENALLDRHEPTSLLDINYRKSQGLLELSRTMNALRGIDVSSCGFDVKAPLARLREKLAENQRSLQVHLTAVQEVALIIARAIQEHESDGTYGAGIGRRESR